MGTSEERGMVDMRSSHNVEETVERVKSILDKKGVTLFALIDHSGEAQKAGLSMPSTKLLIFGNPKAGTPLMVAAPSLAIDLPLKILVWENASGSVFLSTNTPEYLQQRHGFPAEMSSTLAAAAAIAAAAAG